MICPVCQGKSEYLGVVDFGKCCNPELSTVTGYPIYYAACKECAFCWAADMYSWPPHRYQKEIYNSDYPKYDPESVNDRPIRGADDLHKIFKDHIHLFNHLDYGSGPGVMSEILSDYGWNTCAYDPFFNDEYPKGQFDLITLIEVIEHHPNPHKLMAELVSLLKPGGIILFSTMHSDNLLFWNKQLDWWYLSPRNGHVSLYSSLSLNKLADAHGMKYGYFDNTSHVFFFEDDLPDWGKHLLKIDGEGVNNE